MRAMRKILVFVLVLGFACVAASHAQPDDGGGDARTRAQVLVNDGYTLELQGDQAGAIVRYEAATRLVPDEGLSQRIAELRRQTTPLALAQALVNQGYALELQGDLAGAIARYEESALLVTNEGLNERIAGLRRQKQALAVGQTLDDGDDPPDVQATFTDHSTGTSPRASAYFGGYGMMMGPSGPVLHIDMEVDGAELEEVEPMRWVLTDSFGRRLGMRKIYRMRDYTPNFTMDITRKKAIPSLKWRYVADPTTAWPLAMSRVRSYHAARNLLEVNYMTRCDWDSWVAAKGGRICFEPPHGRQSYPRFSRTRYSMGQNNYHVTIDPVLPVPDNLGPFEYTLPIYVRRFDMALLRIKASQTFELQELEWDEREEFYRKMDLDRVTFEVDIFIIIPDPG